MMTTIARPVWKIETRTGDTEPYPEWLELRAYAGGKRFYYAEREAAERMLTKLRTTQPHADFRIAPL